jgi:hypothetical protein
MSNLTVRHYANGLMYETDDAIVSLVYPSNNTNGLFEILCKYGDIFQGEQRFSSLEDAEDRVHYLLFNY